MESHTGSYPYLPLNKVGFRYIILQPGKFDDGIQCKLIQDVSGTDKTPYEALSYVWGSSTDTLPIQIDGITFPVTVNLESALRNLRRPEKARRLWVDAICINQNDLTERSEQVCRMKSIYQHAQSVVIWLGRDDEPVRIYKRYDRPMEDAFQLVRDIAAIPSQDDLEELLSTVASKDTFMVLSRLFDRTWFERVWVLQELAAAVKAEVVCGKSCVSWQTFEDAYDQLLEFFSEEIYGDWVLLDTVFRDMWAPIFDRFKVLRRQIAGKWIHSQEAGLEHALVFILGNFVSELNATDDRDRLYGIMGIVQGDAEPTDPALIPNYHKTCEQVFMELARYLIKGTNNLTTLHAYDSVNEKQPTWAPSWTRVQRPIYLLNGGTRIRPPGPKPNLHFTGNILHTRGVILGRIHTYTGTASVEELRAAYCATAFRPTFSRWEKDLLDSGRIPLTGKPFHDMCRGVFLYGLRIGRRTQEENYTWYDALMGFADKADSEIIVEDRQTLDMICTQAMRNVNGQCAFVTDDGTVGRTYDADNAWDGDLVCYLQGGYSPFLLRPKEDHKYWFLGTCVFDGFMDAEVQEKMLSQEEKLQPFDIV